MRLLGAFKRRVMKFVRDHIIDEDHHDAAEQREIIGYCSGCRSIVRNADGRVISPTEVMHNDCHPRPTMAGSEEVN